MTLIKKTILAACCVLASQSNAHADPISWMTGSFAVTVTEGFTNGGFNTLPGTPFVGDTATATFIYTGALSFYDNDAQNLGPSGDTNTAFGFSLLNISQYHGSGILAGVADYTSRETFLGSSGSASNFQYGSLYKIELGILAEGTILDITHDDGISIFQGETQINPTISGPTSQVTDQVQLAATGDTTLYYSRQNGTPSILEVNIPEPVSMTLLGVGLMGTGMVARRRRRQVSTTVT